MGVQVRLVTWHLSKWSLHSFLVSPREAAKRKGKEAGIHVECCFCGPGNIGQTFYLKRDGRRVQVKPQLTSASSQIFTLTNIFSLRMRPELGVCPTLWIVL